jgi:DNA-binding Lrp family transcriptional regulator
MKNKNVVRRERKAGSFTQIPLVIITDKRLSSGAFRTLMIILSDAPSYKIYKVDLADKIGATEKTVQNHFKELEKLGYMRREKQKYGNYYHISEYGNLKPSIEEPTVVVEDSEPTKADSYEQNQQKLADLIHSFDKHLDDEVIQICVKQCVKQNIIEINGLKHTDILKFKADIDEVIQKRIAGKKEQYKEYISKAEPKFNRRDIMKKGFGEFKAAMRKEIFEKHNDNIDYDKLIVQVLTKNKIVKSDPETDRQGD